MSNPELEERNSLIIHLCNSGYSQSAVADMFDLTHTRVWQLMHPKPKENLREQLHREAFARLDELNRPDLSESAMAARANVSQKQVKAWLKHRESEEQLRQSVGRFLVSHQPFADGYDP